MRRHFIFLFVVAYLLFGIAASAAEPLRIGIIAPLTGPSANWGIELRDGALLSHKQLPPAVRSKIEFVVEDDAMQPHRTVTAFKKLLSASKINFLITIGGGPSGAVAPLADAHQLPMFAITGAESVAALRSFVLRHWVSVKRQAETVLEQLQQNEVSRVAIVISENEPPRIFADELRTLAKKNGIEIMLDEALIPEDRDFRALCSRILQEKVDAVVTALLPGQLGLFAKQLRSMSKELPLYGFSGSETTGELEVAGGALEGLLYPISEPTAAFRQLFRETYRREPELAAPNAYDIIQMIGLAVQERCCSAVEMNSYLHGLDSFEGALGRYGLGKGNAFDIPAVAKTVRNGRFVVLAGR